MDALAESTSQLRSAETTMAIERYSIDHGSQLPEALTNLAPSYLHSTPIDPYDGQPLRFKTTRNGYVVYSIGSNRVDDGGAEWKPRKSPKDTDVTFTVYRLR